MTRIVWISKKNLKWGGGGVDKNRAKTEPQRQNVCLSPTNNLPQKVVMGKGEYSEAVYNIATINAWTNIKGKNMKKIFIKKLANTETMVRETQRYRLFYFVLVLCFKLIPLHNSLFISSLLRFWIIENFWTHTKGENYNSVITDIYWLLFIHPICKNGYNKTTCCQIDNKTGWKRKKYINSSRKRFQATKQKRLKKTKYINFNKKNSRQQTFVKQNKIDSFLRTNLLKNTALIFVFFTLV